MLQQLFLGTGGLGTGARPTGGAPTLGGGGLPGGGGFGGLPTTAGLGTVAAGAGNLPRQVFMIPGAGVAEGASLVQVGIVPDVLTNSIIVAGSRNDLDVIAALIARLEGSEAAARRFHTYHLNYAAAADLAATLTTFLNNSLAVFSAAGQGTSFQILDNDAIVVAEPVSNSLLISATPRLYEEVLRMIERLDVLLPEVVIQVLVAEVDLTNTEEFGVEIGLQSPILFQRGVIPANNFFGGGTVSYAVPTTGTSLVPGGVTVTNSINPSALPGFNFNSTGPLPTNPVVGPGIVGFQGLGNLGTARISPNSNVGGFVFSAASDAFNLLIRALKTQGRIDIMSRPQIMTLDNQTAYINVGREIPIVTSSSVTGTGIVTQNIDRRQVGVILQVTPKISPDGSVLMRVIPEVSAADPVPVNLGNGNLGTALNIQHLETTVLCQDGETVALGGLISKSDSRSENKIPVLGDLPLIGAAFRYRQDLKMKRELLIILTPHVVRAPCDADRILAEESRRINWVLGDVVKYHGTTGLDPILGSGGPGPFGPGPGGACPAPLVPITPAPVPPMPPVDAKPGSTSPSLPIIPPTIPPMSSSTGAPVNPPTVTPISSTAIPANPPTLIQVSSKEASRNPPNAVSRTSAPAQATQSFPSATQPPTSAILSRPAPSTSTSTSNGESNKGREIVPASAELPPSPAPAFLPSTITASSSSPGPDNSSSASSNPDSSASSGSSTATSGSTATSPGKESWKWRLLHKQ